RGPHQARLDSDAEIAAADRSLRAVQRALEGLVAEGLLGHVGPYAHAPDAGRERQRAITRPTARTLTGLSVPTPMRNGVRRRPVRSITPARIRREAIGRPS